MCIRDRENTNIEMSDEFYKLLKSVFRLTKAKPKDMRELIKVYVGLVRHVGDNDLIISKRLKSGAGRDVVVYSLNESAVDFHLQLNSFKNQQMLMFIENVKADRFKHVVESDY